MVARLATALKNNQILLDIVSFCYNIMLSPLLIRYYILGGGVTIKGTFLRGVRIKVYRGAKIHIGPRTMMRNCTLTASGRESYIFIEGGGTNIKNSTFVANQNYGTIEIATGFTSEGSHLKAHEGKTIKIGRDCMFSSGIYASTTDYHSIISIKEPQRINRAKDIIIGNHVWFGRNVSVLKGVIISDDVIVGMNSTVSKTLTEPRSVYAGSPAKLVKRGVSWIRKMI